MQLLPATRGKEFEHRDNYFQILEILIYFSPLFVYHMLNRVGSRALSATGTGSCPEDEGHVHDEVSAPAVAYRGSSFM